MRLAGTGPLQDEVMEHAKRLGVSDHVEFCGHVTDVPSFLAGLDMFVLPSVSSEGLPLAVLEAMAMGLPIVATRIAGIPEVVEDGTNGFLVPPQAPAALADALQRCCEDVALRRRLGEAALAGTRQKHSFGVCARTIGRIYENIIGNA